MHEDTKFLQNICRVMLEIIIPMRTKTGHMKNRRDEGENITQKSPTQTISSLSARMGSSSYFVRVAMTKFIVFDTNK